MERLPILTAGIRVFRGYMNPVLDEKQFLDELRTTFMPGTPLMLRDLGLAAYIPALVPEPKEPGTPDEVAIIAYASDAAYVHARRDTIVGRMYTHTHRGVFDMAISGSRPAVDPIAEFDAPISAFSVSSSAADWQVDGDVVVLVGERLDNTVLDFGPRVCAALGTISSGSLSSHGILEAVGEVAETWLALWFLCDGFDADPIANVRALISGSALAGMFRELMLARAGRLVWVDAPPEPDIERGRAWSYVFQRDVRYFLR